MGRTAQATRIVPVLASLEKVYGAKREVKQDTLIAQALLGLLSIGASTANALKALARLREDYVDWNEVRVSAVAELGDVFESCGVPPANAMGIKRFLNRIYDEAEALTPEFMAKERPDRAYEWFLGLEGVAPQAAAEVAMVWFKARFLPVDQGLMRVVKRLGWATTDATEQAFRQKFQRLIPAKDWYRFYCLLSDHAATVCLPPEPTEDHCAVRDRCEMGQKRKAEEEARRAREEEAARLAAEAAKVEEAPSPKPAAPAKGKIVKVAKKAAAKR